MKRIGALICLIIITMCMFAPASFAASESADGGLKIESSTPEDKAKGVSVENRCQALSTSSKEMLLNQKPSESPNTAKPNSQTRKARRYL